MLSTVPRLITERRTKKPIIKPITAIKSKIQNTFCTPAVIAFAISFGIVGVDEVAKYLFFPPVKILIATAVPIAPTTCINVFRAAEPCGYNSGGSEFKAFVCEAGQMSPIPPARTICNAIINPTDEAGVNVVKNHKTNIIMTKPGIITHFGPYLSDKRPATIWKIPFSALPGNNIKPVTNTDSPAPVCKNIGNTIIVVIKITIHIITRKTPITNIGYLNTRKFSNG